MSESYHQVLPEAELANGQAKAFIINGWPVLVARNEEQLHAVVNRCTHAAATLDEGRVRRGTITCPLHGARFDLTSGKCLGGANYRPLKLFPVRVVDGMIEVAVPDEAPGPDHAPLPRMAG